MDTKLLNPVFIDTQSFSVLSEATQGTCGISRSEALISGIRTLRLRALWENIQRTRADIVMAFHVYIYISLPIIFSSNTILSSVFILYHN